MTTPIIIAGLGNRYRRDDGVGLAVAADCLARVPAGVRVVTEMGDLTELLDVWSGAALAVLVDAVAAGSAPPGTVGRCRVGDLGTTRTLSSHGVDIAALVGLGRALDRLPAELVLVTVAAADTGYGEGLTAPVAAALPAAVDLVVASVRRRLDGPGVLGGADHHRVGTRVHGGDVVGPDPVHDIRG